jgi:WD40 repeat protein
MGAQAASRATNGRMASSAPTRSTFFQETPGEEGEVESRSLDESSVLDFDDSPSSSTMPLSPSPSRPDMSVKGGEWIKIVDLRASGMRTIAHFRLPPSRHTVPNIQNRRHSENGHSSISYLEFSPDGTTLFASPVDGRSFHLFDIHPSASSETLKNGVEGEVWHLYELKRGSTVSEVVEVKWSGDGRWVGVATGRGTVRMSPLLPRWM